MKDFLEDYDNPIMQVFAEFETFLYVVQYNCKTDKMLHNIMLESKKLHIRTLCEFFSNERKFDDDLIYKDFIISNKDLSISVSDELKKFINKSLAHISKKRGKQEVPEKELTKVKMDLIKSINGFMEEIDRNIKTEYKQYLDDSQVQDVRNTIINRISISSTQKGVKRDL